MLTMRGFVSAANFTPDNDMIATSVCTITA